jgi:hypothetical protein
LYESSVKMLGSGEMVVMEGEGLMRAVALLLLACAGCTYGIEDKAVDSDILVETDQDGRADADLDGVPTPSDCDDTDPTVYPGAMEICDGKDNDCDNRIDDDDESDLDQESTTLYYTDRDGDGLGGDVIGRFCEAPRRATVEEGDCDDDDPQNFPGNLEICDGSDNDCDELVDDDDDNLDPSTSSTWFADSDEDGYGDPSVQLRRCSQPDQYVANGTDCNDAEPLARSGAPELCDGVDNDCDQRIDDDDDDVDASSAIPWFQDFDGDTFGNPDTEVRSCQQPVGFVSNNDDCNDGDDTVYLGAIEFCDGQDNNCDAAAGFLVDDADPLVDYTGVSIRYLDSDGDGFGSPDESVLLCEPSAPTVSNADDCDDDEPLAWTGALEICDGADNDCNGLIDDEDQNLDLASTIAYWIDEDGDEHGAPGTEVSQCAQPPGTARVGDDCDDDEPLAWTGALEVCDGVDNDCNGQTDDEDMALDVSTASTFYVDADGDTFGDPDQPVLACVEPDGTVARARDCDDTEASVFNNAPELCDGLDNDCDELVDDEDDEVDASSVQIFYADLDGDQRGDSTRSMTACVQPPDTTTNADDCDDDEPLAWSGADEVCDGVDNDCVNGADEDDVNLLSGTATVWFPDRDGDGFGEPGSGVFRCSPPSNGAVQNDLDCNDDEVLAWTNAPEVCDGVDNNCVDGVDDLDPAIDYSNRPDVFVDEDNDGFGVGSPFRTCDGGAGYALTAGDCDDASALANPDQVEVCDGLDNDCDDDVDDADASLDLSTAEQHYADNDRDTYGDPDVITVACDAPVNTVTRARDCNDQDQTVFTGAPEICDGIDNDCDGLADDDDAIDESTASTFYADLDGDGRGDPALSVLACDAPPQTTTNGNDCDDGEPLAWTNAEEVCDGVDNDCANGADENDPNLVDASGVAWFVDGDGDGFGDPANSDERCSPPANVVNNAMDCDDDEPLAWTGAVEVCDGVDNNCVDGVDELDPALDLTGQPDVWVDGDNDGYGVGAPFRTCASGSGYATAGGDCDDAIAAANPGAVEVCDGIDNDCDELVDGTDAWWNAAYPYRVQLTVEAPAQATSRLPVALDLDLDAILGSLGDNTGVNPDSVRVVIADCDLGLPEVASEFLDGVSGLFEQRPVDDPLGDGFGSLVFVYDEDEDVSTSETLAAGAVVPMAVYFGSEGTASGVAARDYATDLTVLASNGQVALTTAYSEVVLDEAVGGLVESFGLPGGVTQLGSQSNSLVGNGVFFDTVGGGSPDGGWASAVDSTDGRLDVIHSGSVMAIVRATGTVDEVFGGYDYAYTYMMFAGRPELYAKVLYVTNEATTIGPQGASWSAAVRPYQVDNQDSVDDYDGEEGQMGPLQVWSRGGYALNSGAPFGVVVGFRTDPTRRAYGAASIATGRYVAVAGQDLSTDGGGAQNQVPPGVAILDNTTLAVYPHEGLFELVEDDFLGMLEGAYVSLGEAASRD